jgi:hypothetical protein
MPSMRCSGEAGAPGRDWSRPRDGADPRRWPSRRRGRTTRRSLRPRVQSPRCCPRSRRRRDRRCSRARTPRGRAPIRRAGSAEWWCPARSSPASCSCRRPARLLPSESPLPWSLRHRPRSMRCCAGWSPRGLRHRWAGCWWACCQPAASRAEKGRWMQEAGPGRRKVAKRAACRPSSGDRPPVRHRSADS